MQPQNRKLQKLQHPGGGGLSGVGGDPGISFYSGQSSFMDQSSMMETSGIGYAKQQMKIQNMGLAKKPVMQQPMEPPKPPSDKFIHVSQCRNDKCPLQHIWKQQQYGLNPQDKNSKEFDQQFIPHYSCPKCLHDPPKYCSQRCFQQDWFKLHQYECSGQNPESRDSVLLSECQRIEASTPFIKEGYDESTLTPEQVKLEGLFQNISKKDLEFIVSKDANLGKGSYGEVQLAKHKNTGVLVAIKKIEKRSLTSSKIKETLIREIRIQKQLNHEYICRLYTSFEDKDTIYLTLEYASKGNLFYLIRKEKYLSEDTAFYFFIQVCSGIYYMHKQGLIHRDIKPENILIKEGNIIKICDFGWCVQSDANQQRNTFCGTLEYMAPEMIQNKAHNHTLDIWSLGILLYELVHGRAPFTGVHPREIQEKIMRGTIRYKPGLSAEYKDLVNAILKYDTAERLPLIKVFDHPWVRNFEKKYNLSKNVAATVAAANAKAKEREEAKKAKQAAEAKLLAEKALLEAAEKQRLAELEAAEKEKQRQEAIKQQQLEQDRLRKQREEEQKREQEKGMLLYQALEEAEKQYERDQQKNQPDEVSRNEQDADATQIIAPKDQKQKNVAASTFISPRMSDKSMKSHRSQKEQETDAKKKQMALLAIQQAQLKAQQDQLERELQEDNTQQQPMPKTSERRNLNNSISVKSNKKAMHQQASPQITKEDDPQLNDQQRLHHSLRKNLNRNYPTGEKPNEKAVSNNQSSDPSTKNSNNRDQQSAAASATPQDFDKYESEFQVLDETDMNEEDDDSSSEEEDSDSESDDGIPALVLDKTITPATPTPKEKTRSPRKEVETSLEKVSATSNEKIEDSEDDDESTGIKEEEPKEEARDQTSDNNDEDSENQDEEDSDEDSNDSDQDDQEESSEEDEREKRRRERQEKKRNIKGMDPIYDSSQDERLKSGLEEDSSSEDEAEQSFMQKLGGIFFFGCGGDNKQQKDKTKS